MKWGGNTVPCVCAGSGSWCGGRGLVCYHALRGFVHAGDVCDVNPTPLAWLDDRILGRVRRSMDWSGDSGWGVGRLRGDVLRRQLWWRVPCELTPSATPINTLKGRANAVIRQFSTDIHDDSIIPALPLLAQREISTALPPGRRSS